MENNPFISVIVPVYNRKQTISACIQGIRNAMTQDCELLLVDDGSTDGSLSVLLHFEQEDSRIRVFHKENGGVSSARNKGIEHAKGTYILFVDSDDSIFENCFEILNRGGVFNNENNDLIQFDAAPAKFENGLIIPLHEKKDAGEIVTLFGNAIIDYFFADVNRYENNLFYSSVNKFFKRSIIESFHIRFREDVSLGEDQIFVCEYLRVAKSFSWFSNEGLAFIQWAKNERSYGLGGMLRSPQDYFYSELQNYNALISLYHFSQSDALHKFATNYIVNRPITRILFRYCEFENARKYPYKKLKAFFCDTVIPFFLANCFPINEIYHKRIRYLYILLLRRHFFICYITVLVKVLCRRTALFVKRLFK